MVPVDKRSGIPNALLLLVALALSACGTARPLMPVPASLEVSPAMMVQRSRALFPKKPLRFGEWQVADFRREKIPYTSSRRYGNQKVSVGKSRSTAAYSFTLQGGGEPWACHCEQELVRREVGIGPIGEEWSFPLTYDDFLWCELKRADGDDVWHLEVGGTMGVKGEGFAGKLVHGNDTVLLRANHEIEGVGHLAGPPVGYIFESDGGEVGSVEFIGSGAVRIAESDITQRNAIVTAVAALLTKPH